MPARPAAQWRLSVLLRPPAADSTLVLAVERCPPPRRCLTSHTGSLESRRRQGKRHMTGFMSMPSAFPTVWQFEAPPAATMLQWEPPTSPEHRRQKSRRAGVSAFLDSLVAWLENFDAAQEPSAPSPAEAPAAGETILQHSSSELPREITKFRRRICRLDQVEDEKLFDMARTVRRSVRRRVERGDLTADALVATLGPLDDEMRSHICVPEKANKAAAMIRRTLLSVMDKVEKKGAAISPQVWLALAESICGAKGGTHDMQLFWRMVHIMPPSSRAQIPIDQIYGLTCGFLAAQASRHNLFAHWSARAARFSDALQGLTAAQRQDLDARVRSFLMQQDRAVEEGRRLHFAWLVVKAYQADATTDDFLDAYSATVGPDGRLNEMQLWQVLAARAIATGAVGRQAGRMMMEWDYRYLSFRWARLILTLRASKYGRDGLRELCSCLKSIGEFWTVAEALTTPPNHMVRSGAVQAIAAACDDHKAAIKLYDILAAKDRDAEADEGHGGDEAPRRKLAAWHWTIWAKYAERMIKDPDLDAHFTWELLKPRPPRMETCPEEAEEEVGAKMRLVDQMVDWYMEVPQWSERKVLRYVSKCVEGQKQLGAVSAQTLAKFAQVVTRDLVKGQRGRTTRLEWLIAMVAQRHGPDKASTTLEMLRGWRSAVDREREMPRGWRDGD